MTSLRIEPTLPGDFYYLYDYFRWKQECMFLKNDIEERILYIDNDRTVIWKRIQALRMDVFITVGGRRLFEFL